METSKLMSKFLEWITSDEYKEISRLIQEEHDKTMKELDENLSQDMVSDIRDWRVGVGPDDPNTHSWRGVARLFAEKHPEFAKNHGIVSGNQICGMQLCEAAMKLLDQKPEDGWN